MQAHVGPEGQTSSELDHVTVTASPTSAPNLWADTLCVVRFLPISPAYLTNHPRQVPILKTILIPRWSKPQGKAPNKKKKKKGASHQQSATVINQQTV